jgi:[ribosomal protein S5]-alanine N-acetyltransferase
VSRSSRATLPFAPQAFRPVEVHAPGLVRTARMVLRPLRESDRAEYIRILNLSREHLQKFSSLHRDGESDAALFARHLEICRVGDERGTACRRVGVLDGGRIAGCFNLNGITRGLTFEADANWWLAADSTGKGLAAEGVAAMLDYALAELPAGLGLHKVHAAIMPSNTASIRLAERVGLLRQPHEKVSIRIGDRWEFHEVYSRSVLDQPVRLAAMAC